MKAFLVLLTAGWCALLPARAGNITGLVRAEGKEGADVEAGEGTYGTRKYKFAERVDYAAMRDFVVYIEGPVGTNQAPPAPAQVVTTHRVNQRGAAFSPHVLPVVAGTRVEFPNEDDILHNVFSYSDAARFDLGLYKHPEVKYVTFDKPGRVDVFCSIHKAMNCVILVLPNPYFASTDAQGRYLIPHVPPGHYKLTAWHERLPALTKEIQVPEQGEVRLDFTLGILNLPKY
jgi:plastocyanin